MKQSSRGQYTNQAEAFITVNGYQIARAWEVAQSHRHDVAERGSFPSDIQLRSARSVLQFGSGLSRIPKVPMM